MKTHIIILRLILASQIFFSVVSCRRRAKSDNDKLCLTQSCLDTALTMMKNLDKDADPCDSFFQFACGNFDKRTIIPEDKSVVNQYDRVRNDVKEQIYFLFQRKNHTLRTFNKLQTVYDRCMDKDAIEKNSESIARNLFKTMGDFPLLAKWEGRQWHAEDFSWIDQMCCINQMGIPVEVFVDISITTDIKDTKKRVIDIDQPKLGLSKEYLDQGTKSAVVKSYIQMIKSMISRFIPNLDVDLEVEDIYLFERELAKISLDKKSRRNVKLLYNPMKIKDLRKLNSDINWEEYLNHILKPETVSGDYTVIVSVPKYLKGLARLMARTDRRVIANYIFWRLLQAFSKYLPEDYSMIRQKFVQVSTGKNIQPPKYQQCIDLVSGKLDIALGSLYVRNYFDKSAKKDVMEMIDYVRNEYRAILHQLDWMDTETRMAAVEKLENMYPHIAYPDELLDDEKIDKYYKDLNIDVPEGNLLLTILELTKFNQKKIVSKLRKPVDRKDWESHGKSSVVNAFYAPDENSMQFPAGVLQGMFYSPDRPKYLNYASIGFTIGHEMTHGFDDKGRQFDKNGVLRNWWNKDIEKKFVDRTKCIINQYTGFSVKIRSNVDRSSLIEMNLNGNFTQGENIADNGGLKLAYLAYDTWSNNHFKEPKLPGFQQYSTKQMFWFSAANKWCTKSKPEILENMILTDPHAPGEFRIDGPMMNIPEFARDFKCPVGSRMNPERKCSVWAEDLKIEKLRERTAISS